MANTPPPTNSGKLTLPATVTGRGFSFLFYAKKNRENFSVTVRQNASSNLFIDTELAIAWSFTTLVTASGKLPFHLGSEIKI